MKLAIAVMLLELSLGQTKVAVAPPPEAGSAGLRATVDACKPLLMKRHVFRLKGKGTPGATWSAGYVLADGVLKISLQGNGAGAGAASEPFELDVEVPELQGDKGKLEVIVSDAAGAELLRWKAR